MPVHLGQLNNAIRKALSPLVPLAKPTPAARPKLRVLVTRCWSLGGGQVWAHEFADRLASRGHDVQVIFLRSWWPGREGRHASDQERGGEVRYRSVFLDVPLFLESYALSRFLRSHLKRQTADILVSTGLEAACRALRDIARRNPDVKIVYPVHPNPNVREPVYGLLGGQARIHLTEPLPYPTFCRALQQADLILTDSGGVQEEAPSLHKPVLVLRTETERPEAVEAGTVKVVGVETERIVEETERLLYDQRAYQRMAEALNPYGDGHAAERIVKVLLEIHRGAAEHKVLV